MWSESIPIEGFETWNIILFDPSGTQKRVIRNVNEQRVGDSVLLMLAGWKRNTKYETGAAQLTRKGARGSNHNIFPLSFIRVAWLNNLRSLVSDRTIYTYLTTAEECEERSPLWFIFYLWVISLRFENRLFNSRSVRWMNYKMLRKARWHRETLFHHAIRSSGNLIYISSSIPASRWYFIYLGRKGTRLGCSWEPIFFPRLYNPTHNFHPSRMTTEYIVKIPRWTLETYSGVPPDTRKVRRRTFRWNNTNSNAFYNYLSSKKHGNIISCCLYTGIEKSGGSPPSAKDTTEVNVNC